MFDEYPIPSREPITQIDLWRSRDGYVCLAIWRNGKCRRYTPTPAQERSLAYRLHFGLKERHTLRYAPFMVPGCTGWHAWRSK